MDITKVQSSTTRGGLEIALTYDFTDCTVEQLIPFIVAHLNTRYVQKIAPLEKGEKLTEVPEILKKPIKVAELQMDAKGEVKKKKALETTTTTLKGIIEGLSKEEALAKLAELGITFQD